MVVLVGVFVEVDLVRKVVRLRVQNPAILGVHEVAVLIDVERRRRRAWVGGSECEVLRVVRTVQLSIEPVGTIEIGILDGVVRFPPQGYIARLEVEGGIGHGRAACGARARIRLGRARCSE